MSERSIAATRYDDEVASHSALLGIEHEEVVLRYWRYGNLTPLGVANSLVRKGSRVRFAGGETSATDNRAQQLG